MSFLTCPGKQKIPKPAGTHTEFDLKTKSTTVSFDIDKTDISIIEKTISNLGYQANLTPADPAVYDELPDCCKLDE